MDLSGTGTGDLGDPSVQPPELFTDDLPDIGIGAGGVGLELDQEEGPVREELHVPHPHRLEDRVAAFDRARHEAASRVFERESGPAEAGPDDRDEEVLLRPEELKHVRLADAGPVAESLRSWV